MVLARFSRSVAASSAIPASICSTEAVTKDRRSVQTSAAPAFEGGAGNKGDAAIRGSRQQLHRLEARR
ncbi:hypothetical protein BE21_57780 [Sorangium cellulosum]|uniref:Uncharacterized protein n=1 Tax=Sorangium cellulosum TaxID=56 RepID=A0A150U333_SORCE|nr:hypothetical protein BE21_57780 [Sorangium cellulosum]